MLACVNSGAIIGVDGYIVEVEVDTGQGLPSFEIVGLPDSAIKESKDRVRAAVKNSGFVFPQRRITVNLAPADIKKEGPSFDLPIAAALLVCINIIPEEAVRDVFIAGELSLDGSIRPVGGILPMVCAAQKSGITACLVPADNAREAALVKGMQVFPIETLSELTRHLNGQKIAAYISESGSYNQEFDLPDTLDFSDVKGQSLVKRALEVAAAGMHNAMMIGPPGSGKTMMAKRIPSILPDLTFEESLEVTKIYSTSGKLSDKGALVTKRPFRDPHHTISYSALTGGGRFPKPGEISLAHHGILFLDELPEFHKNVLEVLRQPMEDSHVTISRASGTLTFPSDFMLVASMNPCPCGYFGIEGRCKCSPKQITGYLGKISGPLQDRIDIQIEVPSVAYDDLSSRQRSESSADIKARVVKAHALQKRRYQDDTILFNSQLTPSKIEKYCPLDQECRDLLSRSAQVLGMSARAFHKIIKLARTIADLDENENITKIHLAEAIQYRSLDRKYWS